MLQQTAIVQVQIELLIAGFARFNPLQRIELRLAILEMKFLGIEQGFIGAIDRHRPLQGLVAGKPIVRDAGEHRRERRGLMHDVRRMAIVPISSQPRAPDPE